MKCVEEHHPSKIVEHQRDESRAKKYYISKVNIDNNLDLVWWMVFLTSSLNMINSGNFIEYLGDLSKFIKTHWDGESRRIMIVIDNASSHTANYILKYMKEIYGVVFFLPQYTSQYAPVKNFFSSFKSKLTSGLKGKCRDLNVETTKKEIERIIRLIKPSEIISMWIYCFETIRQGNSKFIQNI